MSMEQRKVNGFADLAAIPQEALVTEDAYKCGHVPKIVQSNYYPDDALSLQGCRPYENQRRIPKSSEVSVLPITLTTTPTGYFRRVSMRPNWMSRLQTHSSISATMYLLLCANCEVVRL